MKFGALDNAKIGSHTEDEWQALVRRYMWRCFYCGSPLSAWRASDGRILQIRSRNAARWWETSGKVMAHVEISATAPENILTKDHLVPESRGGVDFIWNIRPVDLRCNRLKGTKAVAEFLGERYVMITAWLSTLPPDDWRVQEWEHWATADEIDAKIDRRLAGLDRLVMPRTAEAFSTSVEKTAQGSTGVFALALDSDLVFDGGAVEMWKTFRGDAFAVAPLPSLEEKHEPGLLKKLTRERQNLSWWKNQPITSRLKIGGVA